MAKIGKEASKKSKNGHRKMVKGSLYLIIEERNENDKRNRDGRRGWKKKKWTLSHWWKLKLERKNGRTQELLEWERNE